MINNVSLSQTNLLNRFLQNNPAAVSPISQLHQKTPQPKEVSNQNTRTSIFYVNDVHGKMTNMERIYSVARQFDSFTPQGQVDKLKLASGDIRLGANHISNLVANKFLDWCGITANALGNHELDIVNPKEIVEIMEGSKYKLLAINAEVNPDSPLYGKIKSSIIEEHNDQKYGIIGIAPSDMNERVKMNASLKDITIDDFDTTLKKVQDEVKRLQNEEGVNKIILLSHSGYKNDIQLAQNTEGIDVILGGHSHDMITDVKEGVNLFYSKVNEPVVITQAGKDGEHIGVLNLEFTPAGVITKVQNNVTSSREFSRILPIKYSVEEIIGKPDVIGMVKSAAPAPKERLIENNPHGNVIADAMRSELQTDIAVLNAGNIRGHFSTGKIDSRLINDITPFDDKMLVVNLSERQLVDAIKAGGKSLLNTGHKPGIVLVSGLKYTMTDKGELKALYFVDNTGKETPIDIDNPSETHKFSVAMDDFFATGGDNYLPVNEHPDFIVKKFDIDKNKLACEYIKKINHPLEIKPDDRITIIPSD